ncbi:MAG: M1 family peptidase, partial [Cyclobacteriaceae bacterium]|nr:M1 family peptidase [Cyclobacteriaceae bacterium]
MKNYWIIVLLFASATVVAQDKKWQGKFEQLDYLLPTPNEYRTGSGAPGPRYWQQKADYDIQVELNDDNQTITGKETITYYNNSPETLTYLWLQLDQNILAKDNLTSKTAVTQMRDTMATKALVSSLDLLDFDGGHKIKSVTDAAGRPLPFTVNYTMMRVDLPQPIKSGQSYQLNVEWSYKIGDRMIDGQRSGLEYFPEDGNYVYTIAQWFPRMCVFDDVNGWQNKQFLGRGEFALPFGDYRVKITVPADHIV